MWNLRGIRIFTKTRRVTGLESRRYKREVTRQRCWKYGWLLEFDIKGAFDNIAHSLLMKALERHTESDWILLYIKRWLVASIPQPDDSIQERRIGTPQGGVIRPLLMNLFMHYVFDKGMSIHYPKIAFARYADEGVVHCHMLREAEQLKVALEKRFEECRLALHPQKTKIVCCKADKPWIKYPVTKFEFLGYEFRLRTARTRTGRLFPSVLPALSPSAAKAIRREMRSWSLSNKSDKSLEDLSRMFGPIIRGWVSYYGHFYRSALYPTM